MKIHKEKIHYPLSPYYYIIYSITIVLHSAHSHTIAELGDRFGMNVVVLLPALIVVMKFNFACRFCEARISKDV